MASPYSYRSRHLSDQRDSYSSRSRDHYQPASYSDRPYHPTRQSSYGYSSSSLDPSSQTPSRRPSKRHSRSERSRKRTWPPPPSVEDEQDYIRKNGSIASQADETSDEASTRGAIDQDPIFIELEQPKPPHRNDSGNGERRFVLVSDPTQDAKSSQSRSSKSSKSRGEKVAPPTPIKTDLYEPPVILERQRSPYGGGLSSNTSSSARVSKESLLSPESAFPTSSTSTLKNRRTDRESSPREPSRSSNTLGVENSESARRQSSKPKDSSVSETSLNDAETILLRRKPSRYSFTPESSDSKTDTTKRSSRSSKFDSPYTGTSSGSDVSRPASPTHKGKPNNSSYAYSSTPKSPQVPYSSAGTGQSSSSQSPRSRPASPKTSDQTLPSRQPKLGDRTPQSATASRPPSRGYPAPLSNLPASSTKRDGPPTPSRGSLHPDSTSVHASFPNDRPRPASRHARQESLGLPPRIDVQSPSPARQSGSLPYPVYDAPATMAMPSIEAFQVQSPEDSRPPQELPYPRSASATPMHVPPDIGGHRRSSSTGRPKPSSRHQSYDAFGTAKLKVNENLLPQSAEARPRKFSLSEMEPLPPCPRPEPTARYDDWYSLEGFPGFAICPDCLNSIFGDTKFRHLFKKYPRRSASIRIQCDFASHWMRIAWFLTLRQERRDLDLVYNLATIAEVDAQCPGTNEGVGTWYSILDPYGTFVSDFYICPCDVRRIEALLPSMKGVFIKTQQESFKREPHLCSLRTESRLFAKYLDILVEIDANAKTSSISSRRRSIIKPDMRPFTDFARDAAFRHECPRDALAIDQTWHFHPSLPHFTICEECYDEVVYPTSLHPSTKNSSIALAFSQEASIASYIPGETTGTSCQLYSPRMRKVWERAVRDNDWGYLTRKVDERWDIERDLKARHRKLLRVLETAKRERDRAVLMGGYQTGEEDVDIVVEQIERLAREWKGWE